MKAAMAESSRADAKGLGGRLIPVMKAFPERA
jgi:hypothetical protein